MKQNATYCIKSGTHRLKSFGNDTGMPVFYTLFEKNKREKSSKMNLNMHKRAKKRE